MPASDYRHGSRKTDSLGRVLLCDDDYQCIPAFTAVLERAGFDAVGCWDYREAEALAAAGRFDACLVDIVTPSGPLGHDLISRLRANPRTAEVAILAMSGFGGHYLSEALRLGADAATEKTDINGRIVPLLARLCRENRAPAADGTQVLIVDDDESVAELAATVLWESLTGPVSFATAPTVRRAQAAIRRRTPNLILLDLSLADGDDGLGLLRSLRAAPETASLPVIVMTGAEPTQAMRECFTQGASDYICKPLRHGELEARAHKLLGEAPLRWGPLHLDHATRRAFLAGRLLDISPKEFLVLRLLIKAKGSTVESVDILRDVWDVPAGTALKVHNRTLLVHMSNLRAKLGSHRRLVKNIRGVGYRLAPPNP